MIIRRTVRILEPANSKCNPFIPCGLPPPPKAGQSWAVDQPSGKSVKSIEIEASVDLPERSYSECLKLHIENLDNQGKIASAATFYFAPGIGCVEGEIEGNKFTTKMRLTKCSLAP